MYFVIWRKVIAFLYVHKLNFYFCANTLDIFEIVKILSCFVCKFEKFTQTQKYFKKVHVRTINFILVSFQIAINKYSIENAKAVEAIFIIDVLVIPFSNGNLGNSNDFSILVKNVENDIATRNIYYKKFIISHDLLKIFLNCL